MNDQPMRAKDLQYRLSEARGQHVDGLREDMPDFRDGQREHRLTVHDIAQQNGFPND